MRLLPERFNTISNKTERPKVILLIGPTGVGKTEILESLFSDVAEVVSADALQIYRGLNIGTSKPGPELLACVPHHLIDIIDFTEQFNVGEFCRLADSCVSNIIRRKKLPVISGGTAYYMRAWLMGMPKTPLADMGLREKIAGQWKDKSDEAVRLELGRIDPPSLNRIGQRDRYRMLRALEVYAQTGRPISDFIVPDKKRSDYDVLTLGLKRSREDLHRRIVKRVDEMIRAGLADELKEIRKAGAKRNDPGMKAIGYREWFDTPKNPENLTADVREQIIRNTQRYAKRQMTFFSSFPETHWVEINPEWKGIESLKAILKNFLS